MDEQRLIDANALIERIKYSFSPSEIVSIDTVIGCFLQDIVSPTIDAVHVVHGHYVVDEDGNTSCSVCGASGDSSKRYCADCGAKMDDKVGGDNVSN